MKLSQGKQLVSILKTFFKPQCTFLPVLASSGDKSTVWEAGKEAVCRRCMCEVVGYVLCGRVVWITNV